MAVIFMFLPKSLGPVNMLLCAGGEGDVILADVIKGTHLGMGLLSWIIQGA